jgi:hypothetical protein
MYQQVQISEILPSANTVHLCVSYRSQKKTAVISLNNIKLLVFVIETVSTARYELNLLTHCGRVTQICVFNTVKLGTSASSP